MNYAIKGGIRIQIAGEPRQVIEDGPALSEVALSGLDFPSVRPEVLLEAGNAVVAGQALFRDRNRPEIQFTSPVSGVVIRIERGRRRQLDSIVVKPADDAVKSFELGKPPRELLLESGLWATFKTRPFGHIPDPDAQPVTILVTATDTNPLAVDPAVVIGPALEAYTKGLEILTELGDAPVIVCQSSGSDIALKPSDKIRITTFEGNHTAGLAGTHYARLGLSGKPVWQINYQDVIAIGRLFSDGKFAAERVISIAGPLAKNPRLLRTVRGAKLQELLAGEESEGSHRVLSGTILNGHPSTHLGFEDLQITVLPAPVARKSIFNARNTGLAAIIPSEEFERVLPQNFLPVPLMRALSVGDWEEAAKLGCLDLLEEDVAPLSYLCSSGNDYAALLRKALDDLQEGAA